MKGNQVVLCSDRTEAQVTQLPVGAQSVFVLEDKAPLQKGRKFVRDVRLKPTRFCLLLKGSEACTAVGNMSTVLSKAKHFIHCGKLKYINFNII